MSDVTKMTDAELADAVDEMFNSPDFDRIKFEVSRRLREYAAKLAEAERERDDWREASHKNGEAMSGYQARAIVAEEKLNTAAAERERLRHAIMQASDECNTARFHTQADTHPTVLHALRFVGGMYSDLKLSPPAALTTQPAEAQPDLLWSFNCRAERMDGGKYLVTITGERSGTVRTRIGYHPLWELIRLLATGDNLAEKGGGA